MKDSPGKFQYIPQFQRIDQISVVGQGQIPLLMTDHHRLDIFPYTAARGGVAHMAYGHGASGQGRKDPVRKNFCQKSQIFFGRKDTVVIGHDAAALLPPVLQSIEAPADLPGYGRIPGTDHSEDPAFFMNGHKGPPL